MKDKVAALQNAQQLAAKGRIDKAIAELETFADSKDGNILNSIGDLYVKKGAKKDAVEYFRKAARLYRDDGFYPKAIALYKKIINILPTDPESLIALADMIAEKGLPGEAVENYLKAADIYTNNGVLEKALMAYERALHVAPFNMTVRIKMTDLYFRMGLKERAATGFSSIASDLMAKGEIARAKELYDKALGIDPMNVSSLIGLSKLLERQNDLNTALDHMKNALEIAQGNNKLLFEYAGLAMRAGRLDEAHSALQTLLGQDPSDSEARQQLGLLHLRRGEAEKAWEELIPCIDEKIRSRDFDNAADLLRNFSSQYPHKVKERLMEIEKARSAV